MNSLSDNLRQIRTLVREVIADLDPTNMTDVVDVGTALASVVRISNDALNDIKTTFRTATLSALHNGPGTESFEGDDGKMVTVTVPPPSLRILKSVDIDRLRRALGDDFDNFFETRVSYKPRPGLGELIMDLPAGDLKNSLLLALEEVDNTPRVSFPKR